MKRLNEVRSNSKEHRHVRLYRPNWISRRILTELCVSSDSRIGRFLDFRIRRTSVIRERTCDPLKTTDPKVKSGVFSFFLSRPPPHRVRERRTNFGSKTRLTFDSIRSALCRSSSREKGRLHRAEIFRILLSASSTAIPFLLFLLLSFFFFSFFGHLWLIAAADCNDSWVRAHSRFRSRSFSSDELARPGRGCRNARVLY